MQRKLTPEELAQKALELMDQAEIFEDEKNFPKAIQYYHDAAEILKQSGYLMHRIEDIYTRITELNNLLQQEKLYSTQTQQVQAEQLQDQGFAILDGAAKLEKEGRFNEAIQQYMNATSLLAQAGWTDTQLDNIKSKMMALAQNLERQKLIQQQKEMMYSQQKAQVPAQPHPQMMGVPAQPALSATDQRTEALRSYEAKKKYEEDTQNQAFALIDNAKMFEKDKNFDAALANYEKAIELLNSIGWTQQTQNLSIVVDKLRRDKLNFERLQAQKQQQMAMTYEAKAPPAPSASKPEPELEMVRLLKYEGKKKKEEETQNKAFNLIDNGKRLEREKKYDDAIKQFEQSIELLKSIGWESYIQPVITFIGEVKTKQQSEIKAEQLRGKRQEELKKLQETIKTSTKEQFVQSAQELELKRREAETKRAEEIEKEKQFFALLDNADNILQEGNYDNAVREYEKALDMLKVLGTGWESYIPSIQRTISSINEKKQSQIQKDTELQKKQEDRRKQEEEFQQQIAAQLKQERERLKQKEVVLKQREDETKYREQRKETTFKFLDTAQEYVKQGDYEKAIYAYQNAGTIFAEIQWTDEIPLIQNSIKELENKRNEQQELKKKQIQETIKRKEEEKVFQKQIARQLQGEREKLKHKEIALREREKELELREKRRDEAFKLMEEAQNHIKQGNFDKAIEIYRTTAGIFAEIQWQDEINLIQNSIIEIENKKREAELRKQVEMEATLAHEKEKQAFEEQITKEMKFHSEKLKQRGVIIRERENEQQYREQRKEEAFKLLDKGQNFLSQGKFDDALEIYHNVANVFAEIQWIEEIPLIQNAIKEIENKKREKELWKQKTRQALIQKEASNQAFADQIKTQREIEKVKLLKKQKLLEEQKEISAQLSAKQKAAFKLIDDGDVYLKEENFDKVINNYTQAVSILTEIGWDPSYLKLIQENIDAINIRKQEKEKQLKLQEERLKQREEEEKQFQQKISDQLLKERERMKAKKIDIQKREVMIQKIEIRRVEAFELMDNAKKLLAQGQYGQSIDKYRHAELILNEIQFPTDAIKEMIFRIQEKNREEDIAKQQKLDLQLKRQQEHQLFQQQVTERMKIEQEKMKVKQIEIQKREELQVYMEKRKNDAFSLLEDAEAFMNRGQYDKSLEYYHSAELILNEIQFSTDVIKQMIFKIQEKKKEQEILKQRGMELQIQKEKESMEYQKQIAEGYQKDKQRLKMKQIQIRKMEEMQIILEQKKEEAFKILEDAEGFTKKLDYNAALETYRKAELILNELQFPTGSIKAMITSVMNLKKEKAMQEEYILQRRLERIEEDTALQTLIDERQREEKEKKLAQRLAIEKREKMIQKQVTVREAAFSMLEEAGKYLKSQIPDFDKAISLYFQARKVLAENIGWEPEINNLNGLINDLQREKAQFLERKRFEEENRLLRQEEFEIFQEERHRRNGSYSRKALWILL